MPRTADKTALTERIERLKQRLVGFVVKDARHNRVGTILDVTVDEQEHLNLVVLPGNSFSPRFLVRTRAIAQIDTDTRTIELLPSEIPLVDLPENAMTPDAQADPIESVYIEQDHQVQSIDATLENEPVTPKAIAGDLDQDTVVQLLEERLAVDYQRRKIGEVIVRKEIETEMIQVPVRRERLIVEQVSPERKPLISLDLGEGDLDAVKIAGYIDEINRDRSNPQEKRDNTISETFSSPKTVAWLMDAIAHQGKHGCRRIRIELELDDTTHAELYRQWFDQCSHR